jgi:hypothetical protein
MAIAVVLVQVDVINHTTVTGHLSKPTDASLAFRSASEAIAEKYPGGVFIVEGTTVAQSGTTL